jgi:hypothetical protein
MKISQESTDSKLIIKEERPSYQWVLLIFAILFLSFSPLVGLASPVTLTLYCDDNAGKCLITRYYLFKHKQIETLSLQSIKNADFSETMSHQTSTTNCTLYLKTANSRIPFASCKNRADAAQNLRKLNDFFEKSKSSFIYHKSGGEGNIISAFAVFFGLIIIATLMLIKFINTSIQVTVFNKESNTLEVIQKRLWKKQIDTYSLAEIQKVKFNKFADDKVLQGNKLLLTLTGGTEIPLSNYNQAAKKDNKKLLKTIKDFLAI